jgi:spore coat polysaccharide biosynthesis protein SpsF (cytidylyltransferase family)
MLTLSKSLLSQKIKQRVQERVADEVATLASYQSRHQILTKLISFCLLQIEFLKEAKKHTGSANGQNHVQSILFEQTLKFLVQLTITKPYVNKESKTMQIKQYFMLDFDTLIQLKDYLKEQIRQNKNQRVIDFKHQRQVVVSLTILMCEFDTLSDSGEVLADVYSAIEQNFVEISQAR